MAMMRSAIFGVLISCLVVVAVEIFFHSYAGTQRTSVAQGWKSWYLERDPQNGKNTHAGFIDLLLPSVALGLAAGIVTARRSKRLFIVCIILMPLCATALFPFYAAALPSRESDEWWRFAAGGTRLGYFLLLYTKSMLLCVASDIFSRLCARHFMGLPQDDQPARV